jgi:hypothetical protein
MANYKDSTSEQWYETLKIQRSKPQRKYREELKL